jgi:hypothetical protein
MLTTAERNAAYDAAEPHDSGFDDRYARNIAKAEDEKAALIRLAYPNLIDEALYRIGFYDAPPAVRDVVRRIARRVNELKLRDRFDDD